jgi:hypothetical protein
MMNTIKSFALFCILLLFSVCNKLPAQTKFYVSVDGNDINPGTREKPLASLTGARNAIRKFKNSHSLTKVVEVIIDDGIYYMKTPFVLEPQDGGTKEAPVIYKAAPGAHPVFSGGITLSDIRVGEDKTWEVKVPEAVMKNSGFSRIYVNGKAAIMARTPDSGFLKIDSVKQQILEKGDGRIALKARQTLYFDTTVFAPLQQVKQEDLKHLRFVTYHKWDFTLRPVERINRDSCFVTTTGKGMKPWNPIRNGGRIIFENYAAALTAPGEWFLNDRGILFYKPRKGETPENSTIIVPVLQHLVVIKGDSAEFVTHVYFQGLNFSHSQYSMPPGGMGPQQASVSVNAAVTVEGASEVIFENCEVTHIGQHAFWFKKGCSHCMVKHCYINDLGGGGIYIGDTKPPAKNITRHIIIDNNIIHHGGQIFPAAVGVWIGHSSDNVISHNDIGDFYYTGVSVGWTWGYAPSIAKRNKIVFNHIHHIGWDLLSDMAAVYTLGKSEGTEVSNNVIDHVHAYSYGGWGLYTDEGSSGIVMENNLVYSTKTGGFHQHYGADNIIRNNIFAFAGLYQIQCTRVEDHLSFDFEHNIVVFDTGAVLKGPWRKINIRMDSNLYFNINGLPYDFAGTGFKQWQQTGHDRHSYIANPGFADATAFDFSIADSTAIKKINFKPFNWHKAGVYGEAVWRKRALLPPETTKLFDKAVRRNRLK